MKDKEHGYFKTYGKFITPLDEIQVNIGELDGKDMQVWFPKRSWYKMLEFKIRWWFARRKKPPLMLGGRLE